MLVIEELVLERRGWRFWSKWGISLLKLCKCGEISCWRWCVKVWILLRLRCSFWWSIYMLFRVWRWCSRGFGRCWWLLYRVLWLFLWGCSWLLIIFMFRSWWVCLVLVWCNLSFWWLVLLILCLVVCSLWLGR